MPTIGKLIFASRDLREQVLARMFNVDAECDELCRSGAHSISPFKSIPTECLPNFKWKTCIQNLEEKAPTLLRLLFEVVGKCNHHNQDKHGDKHYPGICLSIAALLKERNRKMCDIQTVISLVLLTSRVQKQVYIKLQHFTNNKSHQVNMLLIYNNNIMPSLLQVYTRLNHVNIIALSYKATLAVMTTVSEYHKVTLSCWIAKGLPFKCVVHNVDYETSGQITELK